MITISKNPLLLHCHVAWKNFLPKYQRTLFYLGLPYKLKNYASFFRSYVFTLQSCSKIFTNFVEKLFQRVDRRNTLFPGNSFQAVIILKPACLCWPSSCYEEMLQMTSAVTIYGDQRLCQIISQSYLELEKRNSSG